MKNKPDTARFHVKEAAVPAQYYVVVGINGPHISSIVGGMSTIAGPVDFLAAMEAYVKAGGIGYALGLEE